MNKITKQLLTIENLIEFLENNNYEHLSLYDRDNSEIVVQLPGQVNFSKKKENKHREGLIPVSGYAYHDKVNLNKSNIDEDVFTENTKSIKFRPFLANVVEDEKGVKDFGSHDFTVETDEDGNEIYTYYERPVGVVSDYKIEYDEEAKVNRANVSGYLFEGYCQDAVDILNRRTNTDVSVELHIRDLSYNAKEKLLILNDYYVAGVTFLGAALKPGMKGSNISLNELCDNKNTAFGNFTESDLNKMLIETLEKLNTTIFNFNINNADGKEDGQVNKFEELLQKYNKTVEDITFEYESLSDEELEKAFSEAFEKEPETNEPEAPHVFTREEIINKLFELSHDEVKTSLNVLCRCYRTDSEWCYVSKVYDDYFIMEDWDSDKLYKQSYVKDGDVVSLSGERTEMFAMLLTESEKLKLEEMRSNYSVIEEKLDKYVKAEEKANKDALFTSNDYKAINESEEFVSLKDNHEEFSLDELKTKLDGMLLSYAKSGKIVFDNKENEDESEEKEQKRNFVKTPLPVQNTAKKKSRYGSLF